MSIEVIVLVAAFIIALTQLTFVALLTFRMNSKMAADDAALYLKMASDDAALLLQGRRIEDVLKEMHESLRKA